MATNVFFNSFTNAPEQNLIEDLIIESIRQYGHDVFYCPRTLIAKDDIYGEDTLSEYNGNYEIEMYIRSYDSYEGDGQFLSKFNLEIRDQVTFTVALRVFANEIGQYTNLARPSEGDLIYLPMANRILVIKYVNKTPVFYQMGAIQMVDLVCEMWEYSSEKLNTGIDLIDAYEMNNTLDMNEFAILTADGYEISSEEGSAILQGAYDLDVQTHDVFSDNEEFQIEGETILDWSDTDPFSEGAV
jgi:hypothetical protein